MTQGEEYFGLSPSLERKEGRLRLIGNSLQGFLIYTVAAGRGYWCILPSRWRKEDQPVQLSGFRCQIASRFEILTGLREPCECVWI